MGFQEDFQSYAKAIQPPITRIIVTLILTCGLLSYGEISYLNGINTLLVIGCGTYKHDSYENDYSSPSIDTCFSAKMTQCLNQQYKTPNNSSLEFTVPYLGIPDDKAGKFIGIFVIIAYLNLQISLQLCNQLSLMKRKRIQDLLGKCQVFIFSNKKVELKRALYIFIAALTYIALKIGFIINRQNYYSRIECDAQKYHLEFTLQPSLWMGTVIQTGVIFLLFTLQYLSVIVNYLSDMDLRNLFIHFTANSFNQLADVTVLPIQQFERLINKQVDSNYIHLSYFPRLIKKCIYSLPWYSISDDEIVKYVLQYKSQNPITFYPYNIKEIKKSNDNEGDTGRLL